MLKDFFEHLGARMQENHEICSSFLFGFLFFCFLSVCLFFPFFVVFDHCIYLSVFTKWIGEEQKKKKSLCQGCQNGKCRGIFGALVDAKMQKQFGGRAKVDKWTWSASVRDRLLSGWKCKINGRSICAARCKKQHLECFAKDITDTNTWVCTTIASWSVQKPKKS